MAAAGYTTDLADITLSDSGTFTEFTSWTAGTLSSVPETDYYIQGVGCVSSTVKTTQNSIAFNFGSGITVPTDGAVLFWQTMFAPQSLGTWAQGGQRCVIGTSTGAYKMWTSGGSDYQPNPYGGWKNVAIDPTVTADTTVGTVTTLQYFGVACYLPSTAPGKGAPFGLDAIRYGRAEFRVNGGDLANGYATFQAMAAKNDANDATNGYNRWGLLSYQAGSYVWKGLMTLGYTSAVDFRDSNRAIIIDDTPRVGANFNKIEVRQATSRVDWTNITFNSIGTTSRGRFEAIDNADINLEGCLFKNMDTFIFQSGSTALSCIFQSCNLVTGAGGVFLGSSILTPTVVADASAFSWNAATDTDGCLDGMIFSKGTNAHHAINFGTSSPTSMTLRGVSFTGFNASNSQNDSTLYISRTTGTVTINLIGCSGTITYKSAGAIVALAVDPVTFSVHVTDIDTGLAVQGARVLVEPADNSNFPYQESISMTGTGTTVTVTHTDHGLATNDYVVTLGATNDDSYNGVHQITVTNTNTYTFTSDETITATPATGTLTATYVLISGETDVNGNISISRSFLSNQDVVGWVRKGSSSPYYKQQPITGTISSTSGLAVTAQLIRDE